MAGEDLDACQTTTNNKKVAEEKLEIGSKGTSGHVTAKGWFRGVDPGEQLEFSSSLFVPVSFIFKIKMAFIINKHIIIA